MLGARAPADAHDAQGVGTLDEYAGLAGATAKIAHPPVGAMAQAARLADDQVRRGQARFEIAGIIVGRHDARLRLAPEGFEAGTVLARPGNGGVAKHEAGAQPHRLAAQPVDLVGLRPQLLAAADLGATDVTHQDMMLIDQQFDILGNARRVHASGSRDRIGLGGSGARLALVRNVTANASHCR